jgi:hypothetical protein
MLKKKDNHRNVHIFRSWGNNHKSHFSTELNTKIKFLSLSSALVKKLTETVIDSDQHAAFEDEFPGRGLQTKNSEKICLPLPETGKFQAQVSRRTWCYLFLIHHVLSYDETG